MKKHLIIYIVCLLSISLNAQVVVKGFVQDSQSGEPIQYAVVYELGTDNYVFTNNYGFFILHLSEGKHALGVSAVGYKTDTLIFTLTRDTSLNIGLESITKIEKVTVVAEYSNIKSDLMGVEKIPVRQINMLPALGGETDVTKAFQLLPGVVSGNEGSSNLIVRGGSPDQTLVIMDDVPLYYVNHLGGFISTFNSDAISDVTLYKGNFPARFGGRLSSVFDVTMKNGSVDHSKGSITTGLLISKLTLETPILNGKGSSLLSVRTAPIGLLMLPVTYLGWNKQTYFYYGFYDLNAKLNYKYNNKNRLYLSFYRGDDPLIFGLPPSENDFKLTFGQKWGNTLTAFRWNHIFGKKLFSNLTAYYTLFRYSLGYDFESITLKDTIDFSIYSGISDWAVKYDFTWSITNNYTVRFGINNILHDFTPIVSHYKISVPSESYKLDTVLTNSRIQAYEPDLYIENLITTGKFVFNIGLRTTSYLLLPETKFYFFPEPRITAKFTPNNSWALKVSYASTTQLLHLLTGIGSNGLPMDLWLPTTIDLPPERARQWAAGIYAQRKDFEISAEFYYKIMDNLIAFSEGSNLLTSVSSWQKSIESGGKGWSFGSELLIKKVQGKTTGWMALTYSRSFRMFDNINSGNPYPYKYDRPLDISVVLIHRLKKGIILSADWVYGTGYPYTKPAGIMPIIDNTFQTDFRNIMLWEPRNSSRMQDYHRLDIALKLVKKKPKGTRTWTFSIYNTYNRLNPYFYTIQPDCNYATKTCKWTIQKFTLFPIIPSISYSWKW